MPASSNHHNLSLLIFVVVIVERRVALLDSAARSSSVLLKSHCKIVVSHTVKNFAYLSTKRNAGTFLGWRGKKGCSVHFYTSLSCKAVGDADAVRMTCARAHSVDNHQSSNMRMRGTADSRF
ncbi:hypothetical protein HDK90DRAFT_212571 [Phyllosticta capitalensis]|uniref:Secreted protein n=1 Tax=Phyllosticta capitalensis TaxID=121624 RepID=A0ABR1YTG3_9PEZI